MYSSHSYGVGSREDRGDGGSGVAGEVCGLEWYQCYLAASWPHHFPTGVRFYLSTFICSGMNVLVKKKLCVGNFHEGDYCAAQVK